MKKEKLKKLMQVILNKLTPQNFPKMLKVLQSLKIETEEELTLVVDMIHERAVYEPLFSVLYASICKHLALTKVPVTGRCSEFVTFRKLLRKKCQSEFKKYSYDDELKHKERLKEIEAAKPDKKNKLQLEYDEENKKNSDRRLGNIRFVGELFKATILKEDIMHLCLKRLLYVSDEKSLECLCKLLKTIGKELEERGTNNDKCENLPSMDIYFVPMQEIVDKRLTSQRIRFLLQDVIEQRTNNWVPRRIEDNPKTFDHILRVAEQEETFGKREYTIVSGKTSTSSSSINSFSLYPLKMNSSKEGEQFLQVENHILYNVWQHRRHRWRTQGKTKAKLQEQNTHENRERRKADLVRLAYVRTEREEAAKTREESKAKEEAKKAEEAMTEKAIMTKRHIKKQNKSNRKKV